MHQWWWEPWASRLNYWFIDCPRKRRSRHWLMGREEEGSKVVQGNLGRGGKRRQVSSRLRRDTRCTSSSSFCCSTWSNQNSSSGFSHRELHFPSTSAKHSIKPADGTRSHQSPDDCSEKKIKKTHRCWGVGACGRCGLPSPISENLQLNKWTINLKGRVRGAAAGGTCCGAPETPDRHLFPILLFYFSGQNR